MNCIKQLYKYFYDNPHKMPVEFYNRIDLWGIDRVVCDYIAGMTDRYALSEYMNIFVPASWNKIY
jgi:dGTPase